MDKPSISHPTTFNFAIRYDILHKLHLFLFLLLHIYNQIRKYVYVEDDLPYDCHTPSQEINRTHVGTHRELEDRSSAVLASRSVTSFATVDDDTVNDVRFEPLASSGIPPHSQPRSTSRCVARGAHAHGSLRRMPAAKIRPRTLSTSIFSRRRRNVSLGLWDHEEGNVFDFYLRELFCPRYWYHIMILACLRKKILRKKPQSNRWS